ncbi:hypothetical protein AB0D27_07125 [Streptomyces sp. NPDC048415]|uniref:hypothetical protein n=1 Tax=Streptomyces sp. NPDC048415 TaxID=3154822 RepID=UPI003447AFD3
MDRFELSSPTRVSRMHFVLAWALCVLALLLTTATWLPGPNQVPFAAVGVVFVAIFPVFGAALVRALFSEGGRTLLGRANSIGMLQFVRNLSTGLKCAYVVVLAALLLTMATGGAAQDAKTDGRGGHYCTRWNNTERRCEPVPLTAHEYDEATKAQARVFAAGAALFHAMGGFLVLVAASPAAARRAGTGSERVARMG